MLTDTEVKAEALAVAIKDQETFGKDQCEIAFKRVSRLVKDKECDDDTADRARAWLGNHSAVRQWATKQGFFVANVAEDALAKEVKKVIARIDGDTADELPIS
jgi:hypothetical protein